MVSAASADSVVNDSNVISSVGRGTVWKWSNSQIDSNPSSSACVATTVVRRQASSGSQPSYSPVQPCGTMIPIFIGSLPRTSPHHDRGRPRQESSGAVANRTENCLHQITTLPAVVGSTPAGTS